MEPTLLRDELNDLSALLQEIQGGTRQLITVAGDSPCVKKRVTSLAEKRSAAASAWAKSTAHRSAFIGRAETDAAASEMELDVARSEKAVRTRSAAYSIGKRSWDAAGKREGGMRREEAELEMPPPFYDVNIDAVSTRKRAKGTTFPKAERPSGIVPTADDNDEPMDADADADVNTDAGAKMERKGARRLPKGSLVEPSAKAYSFPKSKRDTDRDQNAAAQGAGDGDGDGDGESAPTPLDVERGERWLRPQAPGPVLRPDAKAVRRQRPGEGSGSDEEEGLGPETATPAPPIDFLSTKPRTPAPTIAKEHEKPRNLVVAMKGRSTPGPGDYNPGPSAFDPSAQRGGKVYRAEAKPSRLALEARIPTPGPGFYDVERYYDYTRPPEAAVKIVAPEVSESKVTPQLEQKRYWEAKARDARDDHDGCRPTTDALVRPRTSTVVMRPPAAAGVSWRNRRILRERQADRAREAQGGAYDVNRSLVEPRSSVRVDMSAAAALRAKLQKQARDKPNLRRAFAARDEAERARDKYYGPQLPVTWAEDRPTGAPGQAGHGDGDGDGDEVEDDEEGEHGVEDVLRFLAARSKRKDPREAETTAAFLRSSYSAAPAPRTAVMRPDSAPALQAALAEAAERDKDFIGPQLQTDWAAEALSRARSHKAALKMDVGTGRDELVVPKKGQVVVKRFTEAAHLADEGSHLGPGKYDVKGGLGEEAVKGAPFAKFTAREDAVGPRGEKPQSAVEALHEALGDDYYRPYDLDLDAGKLKELVYSRQPAADFSKGALRKEKGPEYPAQAQLGGNWFEGMSDAVKRQKALVRFDRMRGHFDGEDDEDVLGDDLGVGYGGVDAGAADDVAVRPRVKGGAFQDATKHPRWAEEAPPGLDDAPPMLDLKPSKAGVQARVPHVDMGRQGAGRGLVGASDDEVMRDAVGGGADRKEALRLAAERADAIERGKDATGKGRQSAPAVDLGRQRGRDAPAGPPPERPVIDAEGNVVDTRHVLDLDPTRHDPAYAWSKPKAGGASVWKKETTKKEHAAEAEMDGEVGGAAAPGLRLAPDPTASSRHRRTPAGPAWPSADRPARPGGHDDVDTAIEADVHGTRWANPTPKDPKPASALGAGRGRGGNAGVGGGARDWRKQPSDVEMEGSELDPLLARQEVVVKPNATASSEHKKIKGGTKMSRGVGRADGDAERDIIEATIGHGADQLAIDADDNAVKTKIKGGVGMRPATSQSRLKKEASDASLKGGAGAVKKAPAADDGETRNQPFKRTVTFSAPVAEESAALAALAPMSPPKLAAAPAAAPGPPTLSPARLSALDASLQRLSLK